MPCPCTALLLAAECWLACAMPSGVPPHASPGLAGMTACLVLGKRVARGRTASPRHLGVSRACRHAWGEGLTAPGGALYDSGVPGRSCILHQGTNVVAAGMDVHRGWEYHAREPCTVPCQCNVLGCHLLVIMCLHASVRRSWRHQLTGTRHTSMGTWQGSAARQSMHHGVLWGALGQPNTQHTCHTAAPCRHADDMYMISGERRPLQP